MKQSVEMAEQQDDSSLISNLQEQQYSKMRAHCAAVFRYSSTARWQLSVRWHVGTAVQQDEQSVGAAAQ
jgi:hypothetical protein